MSAAGSDPVVRSEEPAEYRTEEQRGWQDCVIEAQALVRVVQCLLIEQDDRDPDGHLACTLGVADNLLTEAQAG